MYHFTTLELIIPFQYISVDFLSAPIFASSPSNAIHCDVISTNANETLLLNTLISTNYYTFNEE